MNKTISNDYDALLNRIEEVFDLCKHEQRGLTHDEMVEVFELAEQADDIEAVVAPVKDVRSLVKELAKYVIDAKYKFVSSFGELAMRSDVMDMDAFMNLMIAAESLGKAFDIIEEWLDALDGEIDYPATGKRTMSELAKEIRYRAELEERKKRSGLFNEDRNHKRDPSPGKRWNRSTRRSLGNDED